MGFIISPDSAFQRALEKVKFRCPSEFGNFIFADDNYYYITVGPVDSFLETAKGISRPQRSERPPSESMG